jgi:hypothetical protein
VVSISDEKQLDSFPSLREVISKTPMPQSDEDRTTTITAMSQQEWIKMIQQFDLRERKDFVLQYKDSVIDVRTVWSPFPPSTSS